MRCIFFIIKTFLLSVYYFDRRNMRCGCFESGRKGMTISVIILSGAVFTILLSYLAFGDANDTENSLTLKMIGVLFRHGNRSPLELYPNDPHINYQWSGGLGSLSEKGSLQMYNLGKNLRKRYSKILPSNGMYSKNNMLITSSAAERCLMSAQSFMAGFMPPIENHNILPILWQPVPINSLPRKHDYLLAQKKPCRKYDETLQNLLYNPTNEIQKINEDNKDFYKMLTKNSGMNVSNLLDIEILYNTLEVEKDAGLILPNWANDVLPHMLNLAKRSLAALTETHFMKKIKGGAILTEITDNMIKKRDGNLNPDRSIFFYSAHDVTLVNLMRTLDIISQTSNKPEYSSAFVFELHYSNFYKDDLEVKLLYYFNEKQEQPKELIIPNCDAPCLLTNFLKTIDTMLLRNFDESCLN